MPQVDFQPEVRKDLERFVDHMSTFGTEDVFDRLEELLTAIQVLGHSPLIGRPARGGRRELVVGRGARSYVVRYRYVLQLDTVLVLAIRAQRERGYKRRPKS